jgi:VWFA-related protein
VLVDVVVNDDKGAAVPGLHKEDFEILEEGKPQTIANFQEHLGAPLTQIKLPPMPPHVFTNFPLVQSADSVIVLLLDALNTPSKDQSYVHSQMIRYLRTTPPGTRMAIFTLASQLRMLQGMTTDSKELLAAVNNAKANPESSPLRASAVESDANQGLIDFMSENSMAPAKTLAQASVDPINAMKEFLADTAAYQTEARTHMTLEAFQQLGRYLSTLPGRKNVIWVSASFPTGIFPDAELADPFQIATTFQEEIRETDALLAASQVALYPIAAEGLASDAVFEANNKEIDEKRPSLAVREQVRQMQSDETDRDLSHQAMEIIARDTGGHAFYHTNGLRGALDRVIENGTHHYSLAYSSTNTTMDGRYRRIQFKLLNRKDSLPYRRGYYASELGSAPAQGQKTDSDPLLPLMGRNMPDYTQVLYKLLVQPSDPQPAADAPRVGSNLDVKGPFTRYSVDFAIAARDLKLEAQADKTHHATVELRLVAYDREDKPVNLVETKGDVLLQPEEFAAVQKSGLPIHQEIDLPKEYVYLRTGVYDLRSNAAGTLGVPLPIEVSAAAK